MKNIFDVNLLFLQDGSDSASSPSIEANKAVKRRGRGSGWSRISRSRAGPRKIDPFPGGIQSELKSHNIKRRGRPAGSKNRSTLIAAGATGLGVPERKKPGRKAKPKPMGDFVTGFAEDITERETVPEHLSHTDAGKFTVD